MSIPTLRGLTQALSELEKARGRGQRKIIKATFLGEVFRLKGSIIPRVIWPVLCITAWASLVAAWDISLGHDLHLTNQILPLLSVGE